MNTALTRHHRRLKKRRRRSERKTRKSSERKKKTRQLQMLMLARALAEQIQQTVRCAYVPYVNLAR